MDEQTAILDYASPRKRGRLRLPATSDVVVSGGDGTVVVEESLAGQGRAVAGLVFGAVVVLLCSAAAVGVGLDLTHHGLHRDAPAALIMAALAVAEAATMVGVVQQTWRRTRLTVEFGDLRLAFLSPLHRRRYRWAGEAIADVVVVLTANAETGLPLAEVLITRVSGGDVHLFTDHPAVRLGPIARAVHDMLRDGRADPLSDGGPADAGGPPVVPDLLPRAERTAGRLVDRHRAMREHRGDGPPRP